MCGISAAISKNRTLKRSEISAITSVVKHRGPDGDGVWTNEGDSEHNWIGIGHTRLSILDLSSASGQPFLSRDGRYALTFNGEIYNFLELRIELVKLGYQFVTDGDTEVLMFALVEWGVEALRRLRGMFAFVFVDVPQMRVLVARDEFGIKPLYKCTNNQNVYFASEIKQFAAISDRRNRLNTEASMDFLLYGLTDHRRETHFQDVEHVLPGECIFIDGTKNFHESRFTWRKTDFELFGGSYKEACDEYQRLLLESVSIHLRADVEIGSCLSGGLDSSAIVGIAARNSKGSLSSHHTFTATSEDPTIDETVFAQAVIDATNSIPHFIQPNSNQLWEEMRELAWHQDEPFGSTSIYAQWCVFKAANESNIKVMLDGQGADEQLGGYNSFIHTHLGAELRSGKFKQFAEDFRSFGAAGRVSPASFIQYMGYSVLNEHVVKSVGRRLGVASQNHLGWVNSETLSSASTGDPFRTRGKVPRTVRELSTDMVFRSNLPMLLRFEDRNSMAHGVEARVPFVDGPLMHFALSLPAKYLMQGSLTKPLLRDAAGEFMPALVRNRRDKIGFQTAEQKWFRENPERVTSLVEDAIDRLPSLFGGGTLRKINRVLSGEEPFNNIPWRVLSTFIWADAHNVEE